MKKIIKSCKATNLEFLKLEEKLGLCLYEDICDEQEFILMPEKRFIQHDVENKQSKEENEKLRKETKNEKVETRNEKLETKNEKLQTRNEKLQTRNEKVEMTNEKKQLKKKHN